MGNCDNRCIYGMCEHYRSVDDGEGYPPNPYCAAAEEFLSEWDQECIAPDKKVEEVY